VRRFSVDLRPVPLESPGGMGQAGTAAGTVDPAPCSHCVPIVSRGLHAACVRRWLHQVYDCGVVLAGAGEEEVEAEGDADRLRDLQSVVDGVLFGRARAVLGNLRALVGGGTSTLGSYSGGEGGGGGGGGGGKETPTGATSVLRGRAAAARAALPLGRASGSPVPVGLGRGVGPLHGQLQRDPAGPAPLSPDTLGAALGLVGLPEAQSGPVHQWLALVGRLLGLCVRVVQGGHPIRLCLGRAVQEDLGALAALINAHITHLLACSAALCHTVETVCDVSAGYGGGRWAVSSG
jgi:hypothetical protein